MEELTWLKTIPKVASGNSMEEKKQQETQNDQGLKYSMNLWLVKSRHILLSTGMLEGNISPVNLHPGLSS